VGLTLDGAEASPIPRPVKSKRRPFPDFAEYTPPNTIWIYDTTHFPRAGMAVLIIEDLLSRKWFTEIVSVEETSTHVELGFTAALEADGLEEVEARYNDHVDHSVDLTFSSSACCLPVADPRILG
jgi:putative transposase